MSRFVQAKPVLELCYRLLMNGLLMCKTWPYAYDKLSDGTQILPFYRRVVRDSPTLPAKLAGAYDVESDKALIAVFNRPYQPTPGQPLLTNLTSSTAFVKIYRRVFPRIPGLDQNKLADWFITHGAAERKYTGRLD